MTDRAFFLPPALLASLPLMLATLGGCAPTPASVAAAEKTATPAAADGCVDITTLQAAHLYGSWQVELPQAGLRGQLTLRQHPEYAASLRGEFRYGGHSSIASGDVEEGEFSLDESRDGKNLHAFWTGQLVPAACGAEIRGKWQRLLPDGAAAPAGEVTESDFILRRPPQ